MNIATKKEFLASLREADAKHDRMVIVPRIVAALLLGFFLAAATFHAFAEPIAQATVANGQIVITVYSEDCQLKDVVSNLPKRATWVQQGRTFEGCVGVQPSLGVAMFYFREDHSVAAVPVSEFVRVIGA